MMKEAIEKYIPCNQQEEKDKQIILQKINEKDVFSRKNQTGHFSASAWIVNHDKSKVLLCYHLIYQSWSWLGGHADGNEDLKAVILKEVHEESGLTRLKIRDDIFSLEVLTVNGHMKNGQYISGHLHYNVTYLIEANENEDLVIKEDENSQLKWFKCEEVAEVCQEKWMNDHIYQKLNQKLMEGKNDVSR